MDFSPPFAHLMRYVLASMSYTFATRAPSSWFRRFATEALTSNTVMRDLPILRPEAVLRLTPCLCECAVWTGHRSWLTALEMAGLKAEVVESDGDEGSSSDGGEDEIQGAVQRALDALVGLRNADDLDAAMQEVSHQRIARRARVRATPDCRRD